MAPRPISLRISYRPIFLGATSGTPTSYRTVFTSLAEAVDGPQGQARVGVPHALSVKQEQVDLGARGPALVERVVRPCAEGAPPSGGAGAQGLGSRYARPRPRAARQDLGKGAQPAALPGEPRSGEERQLAQVGASEGAVVSAQVCGEPEGTPEEVAAERDRAREVPPLEIGLAGVRVREAAEDVGSLSRGGRRSPSRPRLALRLGSRGHRGEHQQWQDDEDPSHRVSFLGARGASVRAKGRAGRGIPARDRRSRLYAASEGLVVTIVTVTRVRNFMTIDLDLDDHDDVHGHVDDDVDLLVGPSGDRDRPDHGRGAREHEGEAALGHALQLEGPVAGDGRRDRGVLLDRDRDLSPVARVPGPDLCGWARCDRGPEDRAPEDEFSRTRGRGGIAAATGCRDESCGGGNDDSQNQLSLTHRRPLPVKPMHLGIVGYRDKDGGAPTHTLAMSPFVTTLPHLGHQEFSTWSA